MKDITTGQTYLNQISEELIAGENTASDHLQELTGFNDSKIHYSPVFNRISDAIIVHNKLGRILFMNSPAKELCDISFENTDEFYLSEIPSEFVKYQQSSQFWGKIQEGNPKQIELAVFDESKQFEYKLKISIQSIVWGNEMALLAITEGYGDAARYLEELSSTRIKADAIENKFRTLFEKTTDGIFINDHAGNFIDVNQSSCQMLGYTKDELLNLNINDVILAEGLEKNPIKYSELRLGNTVMVERDLLRKDGTVFPAEISGVMFADGRMQGVVRDISSHRKLENELIQAQEKAEENEHLQTEFLRNMSHEIRTPLNAIIGFADLLPESFDDLEKLNKFSKIIREKGYDLIEIINDILDFSNIESGQVILNPVEYNMSALFSGIENHFSDSRRRLDLHHVDFNVFVSSEIKSMQVIVDPEKLKQVLINLVSNAFKFTSSGSIVLGCELSEPEMFTFYVSDTGIGVPKEIQNDIFGRFTKVNTDTSRIYGGTGIGLSIVQGLLNLMGGKIWIESEECNGSTFYFSLPFKQVVKTVSDKKAEIDFEKLNRSKFKVLIVEDNYYNTEYLQEVLDDSGITYHHTKSGQKAIEICSAEFVPIILLNLQLADMSGLELAMRIKKLSPQTQIIAQTTYVKNDEMERAISAGCAEYLSSPIKPELLISKTHTFLRKLNNLSRR